MMCVPVAEMLEIGMVFFDFSKHSFLIFTVLKETYWAPPGVRAGIDDTQDRDVVLFASLLIRSNDPPACLIDIIFVTFVKNCFHCLSRKRDGDFRASRFEHL